MIVLRAERLELRALGAADIEPLARIANDRRIADGTISVPHPFTQAAAENWIAASVRGWIERDRFGFGIHRLQPMPELIGYIGLHDVSWEHSQAELSFWISGEHEGLGFVKEAAQLVIEFAFDQSGLNRLCAFHMVRNSASRRLLERLGFSLEGTLRQRVRKWNAFEDVLAWSLLRSDARP